MAQRALKTRGMAVYCTGDLMMRTALFVAVIFVAAGLIFSGCNAPSSTGASKAPDTAKQAKDKSDAKPSQPPKPSDKKDKDAKDAKKKPMTPVEPVKITWGSNVLKNASFNEWAPEGPTGWVGLETESNKPVVGTKVDGGGVSMPMPEGTNIAYIKQKVSDPQVVPGAHLRFGATVKTANAEQLYIALSYIANHKEEKIRLVAKQLGDWQELSKDIVLPKEADPKSVQFFVFRKPGATGEVLVKDVFVQVGK
jgi:hypothetical protein